MADEKRYRVTLDLGDELGKLLEQEAQRRFLPLTTFVRMIAGEYVTRLAKRREK